jgi:CheY-like chemotaxis protein/two-component sensor histidine kinase
MRVRGDSASTREHDIIERQVDHLIHLVDDLLDISRIARGDVQLTKRTTKLAPLVTKALEIVEPLYKQRQHRLDVVIPKTDIWLEADETRICQVLSNLLSNAAKYTPKGGAISLRIEPAKGRVRITVEDNGVGIAPDLLPQIFGLFVQGPRDTDRSRGGLGVGLALVENLVALHGGTVHAHSDGIGRGSRFVVELPTIARNSASSTPNSDEVLRRRIQMTPQNVLVVDDNEDAGLLLAEMLRTMGHEVRVAVDGPRALDAMKHFTPHVAILDLGLPVMDGYELASELRKRLGSSVRLMALTGYGQERDRERSRNAGFDAHLVKPIGLSKILAAIEVATQPEKTET